MVLSATMDVMVFTRIGSLVLIPLLVASMVHLSAGEEDREAKLRAGLKDRVADFWVYDDLEAGYAAARKSGKPLLVSFRCVP